MNKYRTTLMALSVGLFAAPILASLSFTSTTANFIGSCLMLTLAAVMFVASPRSPGTLVFRSMDMLLIALTLFVILGWWYQGVEFWSSPRSFSFLAALMIYLASSRVFANDEATIKMLYRVKLSVLALTGVFFVIYIYAADPIPAPILKHSPPIFSHLRHLNYELYFGTVLTFYTVLTGRFKVSILALLALFLFLTIWSAGRGSIVAILAALATLTLFSRHLPVWRLTAILLAFAVISTSLIHLTNKQYLIADTLSYSVPSPATISLEKQAKQISTGRTSIWEKSIETVVDNGTPAILTGLGPDAFHNHQILPGFKHPHNSAVQAFMEFGLIGLSVFIILFFRFAGMAIQITRTTRDPRHHLVVAMFAGGIVFAMVDGIFHHIGPLAMMMFTLALIRSASPARAA